MAESDLSITYISLMNQVAFFLGWGADYTLCTAGQQAALDSLVQSGLRKFYNPPICPPDRRPHNWSFLQVMTTLNTTDDDEDQDLPDDFGNLIGNIIYSNTGVKIISASDLLNLREGLESTGIPCYGAIRPKTTTGTTGQRSEIMWYPTPDATYTLTYRYRKITNKLSVTNLYPYGGQVHSETLLESCLAVAEQRQNDEMGVHWQAFLTALAASIQHDRDTGAQNLGYNVDRSDGQGVLNDDDRHKLLDNGVIHI